MKTKLFIILILFSQYSFNQTNKNNIETFFLKFIPRELPFKIALDSLYYYGKTNINSEGNYLISKYKNLTTSDLLFIPIYSYNQDTGHYLRNSAIFKFKTLKKFSIILYNREIYAEDIESFSNGTSESLILCTYNIKGELIDTLTFAKYILPNFEQFGEITTDLHISLKKYLILPDSSPPGLNAFETINSYYINDQGKFILISSLTKKEIFFINNNEYQEYNEIKYPPN